MTVNNKYINNKYLCIGSLASFIEPTKRLASIILGILEPHSRLNIISPPPPPTITGY
jgi:hypothetical protein